MWLCRSGVSHPFKLGKVVIILGICLCNWLYLCWGGICLVLFLKLLLD